MDKNAIIEELAKNKTIELLIQRINGSSINDLAQDLYIDLLSKKEEYIKGLFEAGELNFFIVGCIKNNLYSKTSPYFIKYKRMESLSKNIEDLTINEQNLFST